MVSAPLEWSEVNEDLTPENFTIYNMIQRVKKKGDVWRKGFFDKKVKETNFKALKSFL
jgi:bifunctional non-homologous end joining protein LigD